MTKWQKTQWLNNKFKRFKYIEIERPCKYCGYCPYGQLVEEFPIERGRFACPVFGHDCPVYYHAEPFVDETRINRQKEKNYQEKISKIK